MSRPSESPSVFPMVSTALEPAVEPVAAEENVQLSLKVRTLDQKTYSITICAAASVPQLKELVAVETGITLARQRLIYRGRVLKNDQTLASYSLEDGHVLHLVVRAVPPPPPPLAAFTDDQRPATSRNSEQSADRASSAHADRASAPHLSAASHVDASNEVDALNAQLDEFQRTTRRSRARSRQLQSRTHSPPPPPSPRNNDEPDPTMMQSGAVQPGHVLMGATIAVPEGTGVTMPFLSSLVANLITQVSETGGGVEAGGATTGTAANVQHHVTNSREAPGGATAVEMNAVTARAARAFRHHHRNRDDTVRQRTARRSSSGVERQAALRARIGLRLEAVRATLDDASLQFPTQLTALPQGNNTAMSELQQQVEMLLTLLERFGPRLRLLPAALTQRDYLSGRVATASVGTATISTHHPSAFNGSSTTSAEFTTPSAGPSTASVDSSTVSFGPSSASAGSDNSAAELVTALIGPNTTPAESGSDSTTASDNGAATEATLSGRQIICIIEALQTIGESTELLARVARHAFVRQSIQLSEPIPRRGDAATAGDRRQATFHARARPANTARANATAGDRTQVTLDAMQAPRSSRTVTPGMSSMRPRMRMGHISTTESLGGRSFATPRTARASSAGLPGLALSFPIDLSNGTMPPVPGPVTLVRNSQSTTGTDAAPSDGDDASLSTSGAHISISSMGLPLVPSVVFPFSLAAGLGGSHATTTWNLPDFISRLTTALPISTMYGVVTGDATHLHHILAQIGFALFSGVDVPRVTRPSIHTWVRDLVAELRRLLRLHALPADVMDQVNGTGERRLALGDELLRIVEPFIPNLVDVLVRATSASRAAAFGASSATLLRTITQQIVRELRTYARGDASESEDESDERLKRLLRGLLVWLGMHDHMTRFVVDSLLCWIEDDSTVSRRGRTYQWDDVSSDAGGTDSLAAKRKRE